jgi:hypothetical protein
VHFPESILQGSSFGRPREQLGAGMRALVRQMTKYVEDRFTQRRSNLSQYIAQTTTVRAQVVAMEDKGYYSVFRAPAAYVVTIDINRALKFQSSHGLSSVTDKAPDQCRYLICSGIQRETTCVENMNLSVRHKAPEIAVFCAFATSDLILIAPARPPNRPEGMEADV